jgi:hypothetical protein
MPVAATRKIGGYGLSRKYDKLMVGQRIADETTICR